MTNDGDLLREYSEHDSGKAFAALVERHVDFVYGAALRQLDGDVHRAKDVTQGVFADLARKAEALSRRSTLVGWLHISVHHAAAQLRRGEQRRKAREQEAHTMQAHLSEPGPQADWERLRPALDTAISELSEADREAVLLRFFEQRPFAEIAAALQVGEEAARKRVARALDKLHALLARRGITSTAVALGTLLANQTAISAPMGFAAAVSSTALAAGATSSGVGAAAGLLKFMSTTKMVTATATVVALFAVGSAFYQATAHRESATALSAMSRERDDLRARLSAADKNLQPAQQDLAAAQSARADSSSASVKAPEAKVPPPSSTPNSSPLDYVLDHPETHAAYVQQAVLRAKAKNERFFQAAGLSAEQQDEFLRQMKAQQETALDLMAAIRSQGYGTNGLPVDPQSAQQLATLAKQTAANSQTRLKESLGDDRYKQYLEYASTLTERNVVDQLASQLYDKDAVLSRDQADQLTQILKQNRFSPQSSTMAGVAISPEAYNGAKYQAGLQGVSMDWQAPVTDAAVARAETVLTPAQMAALRLVQALQVTQLQLAPPPPTAPKPNGGQ